MSSVDLSITFNMGLAWQIRALQVQGTSQNLYTKDGASGLGGQSCWVGFVPNQEAGVAVLTNGVGADQASIGAGPADSVYPPGPACEPAPRVKGQGWRR
jgi:hypothetical protein